MAESARPSVMDAVVLGEMAPLLAERKEVVWCAETATVTEALALLRQHNVLSLPVRSGDEVVGMVNLADIVTAAVFQPVFNSYNTDTDISELDADTLQAAQNLGVFDARVGSLLGLTHESERVWTYRAEQPIRHAVEAMVSGVHRALLTFPAAGAGAGDRQVRVFSQTDVVRLLRGRAELAPRFARTVSDLGLVRGGVVSVRTAQTALTAYRRMLRSEEQPLAAVAVVGEEGRLEATLSLSDLRGFRKDFFTLVLLGVPDFLKFVHDRVPPLVTCAPDDPLGRVADSMLQARVHRAWVVDAAMRPVGVVSLSDVLRAVCYES